MIGWFYAKTRLSNTCLGLQASGRRACASTAIGACSFVQSNQGSQRVKKSRFVTRKWLWAESTRRFKEQKHSDPLPGPIIITTVTCPKMTNNAFTLWPMIKRERS
jgi:hypothetical protein